MEKYKEILKTKPPDTLFHYTNQEGLIGIIKNKEIWASKIHYLNDSTEFQLAINLAHKEIEKHKNKNKDTDYNHLFNEMHEEINWVATINICVCSFSEDGDSLSQWRGYRGKTGNSNYAIGFKSSTLLSLSKEKDFVLVPCIYNKKDQTDLMEELISDALEKKISTLPNRYSELGSHFTKYAPIIKHKSFSEEREWRLISEVISCTTEGFDFRPNLSMITPFYKFPLTKEDEEIQLNEIVVGPTPHMELSKRSTELLLFANGINDIFAKESAIPYRNW